MSFEVHVVAWRILNGPSSSQCLILLLVSTLAERRLVISMRAPDPNPSAYPSYARGTTAPHYRLKSKRKCRVHGAKPIVNVEFFDIYLLPHMPCHP